MSELTSRTTRSFAEDRSFRFLDDETALKIDQALCKIGEFGEVRLVVVKGRLRYIQTMQSENVREAHVQE
jgi:hypothetical protein